MLYDVQQLYENLLNHDRDDRRMYKQYKCMIRIVHNNNERIQLDDALERKKNGNSKKKRTFDVLLCREYLFQFLIRRLNDHV
jgi:hypothetical protein